MPRSSRLLLTLKTAAALLPRRTQRRTLFYGWGGFQGEGASALADAVKATDVRVAYLRHGNTEPNEVDFDRTLTKQGRWQAVAAAKSYGLSLRPFLPTALSSEAPRAVETAQIFLEDAGRDVELVTDRSLYDGTMQPEGSAVFREIGYAPLDFYLKDGRANAVLGDYAENAAARVAATLAGFGQCSRRRTLVVVGHVLARCRRHVGSPRWRRGHRFRPHRPSTSRPRPSSRRRRWAAIRRAAPRF
mmetsp:Transcript_16099/g.50495  ORF Transcript_16099/g.50495 Transcript_16099/m.50495 type:complete len:245 (-) Transcript_16099:171-905(-)